MSRSALICGIALLLAASTSVPVGTQTPDGGLVVTAVERDSAPDRAALKVGDILISWTRADRDAPSVVLAHGDFRTPFDARGFELEQLPRGGTTVVAARGGSRLSFRLIPGVWGVTVRPQQIREDDPWTQAWLLTQRAASLIDTDHDQGQITFASAASVARQAGSCELETLVLDATAHAYFPTNDFALDLINGRRHGFGWSWAEDKRKLSVAMYHDLVKLRAACLSGTAALATSRIEQAFVDLVRPRLQGEQAKQDRDSEVDLAYATADRETEALARIAPDSTVVATSLVLLSRFALLDWAGEYTDRRRASLTKGLAILRRASEIFEKTSPRHVFYLRGLEVRSGMLGEAGSSADEQGQVLERLIQLADEIGYDSQLANEVGAYGLYLNRRGRWEEALTQFIHATQLAPDDPAYWSNAGVASSYLGDTAAAENATIRAAAIVRARSKTTPRLVDSPTELRSLSVAANNLAENAATRGDFTVARVFHEESLALRDRLAAANLAFRQSYWQRQPDDLPADRASAKRLELSLPYQKLVAGVHQSLARTAAIYELLGDRDGAIRLIEEEERIVRASADFKADAPLIWGVMGRLERLRGNLAASEAAYVRQAEVTPVGTTPTANMPIGQLRYERGDYAGAADAFTRNLAALGRISSSSDTSETLHWLGRSYRALGRNAEALAYFEQAVGHTTVRRLRMTASPLAKLGAASASDALYDDYIDLSVADGRPEAAFELLERERGQTMFELMTARELIGPDTVPANLAQERRQLEMQYDDLQSQIARLNLVTGGNSLTAKLAELQEVRVTLDGVDNRIRTASPRLAAWRSPKPLSVPEARATLDPGTVWLSYAVGADRTYLFVLTPVDPKGTAGGFAVFTLPIGEKDLRSQVEAFRNLIDWSAGNQNGLDTRARSLYDVLIRPAESIIATGQRIAISPDGPLHGLPFGALVRREKGAAQYLVEWRPLHVAMSAGLQSILRGSRRSFDAASQIVIFADPKYPPGASDAAKVANRLLTGSTADPLGQFLDAAEATPFRDAELKYLVRGGAALQALPGTRIEAATISALFGSRAVMHLGTDATEIRAKALDRSARYIHFAVHGVLNERFPLNSALALTIPESPTQADGNGLLQAWEIFEHVRIDADLVTLSACDSALGREVAGEGLMGLSQAFLYAGARSVAGSLWKVADGATVELMKRFYANLKAGQTKDVALQNAQIALIRLGREGASTRELLMPINWASFQLTGDWK